MPQLSLSIQTSIVPIEAFSLKELKTHWLQGIPLSKEGKEISDTTLNEYIAAALGLIEDYLGLKLKSQIVTESLDFYRDDWIRWSYIKVSYPVVAALMVDGYYGEVRQVSYPANWFVFKESSDGKSYHRVIRLVPTYNGASLITGSLANLGLGSSNQIPGFWNVKYITGYQTLPPEMKQAIAMTTCLALFPLLSDMISGSNAGNGGLGWGISSKSISLDGLSQSTSSFVNGQSTVFSARAKQYSEILWGSAGRPGLLDVLKDSYSSIIFGCA